MIFLILVILVIMLLIFGAYNIDKGQFQKSRNTNDVLDFDSYVIYCEANYQQPNYFSSNQAIICDQLMLHLYALY